MENSLHYYQIYFNSPLPNPFTYSSVLPDLEKRRVIVSLRNQKVVGYVDSRLEKQDSFDYRVKEIIEVIDDGPVITQEQRDLAEWISRQYLSTLGEALSLFFSFTLKAKKKDKQEQKKNKENLERIGLEKRTAIKLNDDQEKKFSTVKNKLFEFNPILLHGVTGSGKTFFYLKMVEECLVKRKQVIILVPEITLIFQIYDLCQKLFPDLGLAKYHSKIGDKKREKVKKQIRSGQVSLLVTTRSGFFLPFKDLGLIIIDEEHESSYKNGGSPRYQLKQVAYYWAELKRIPLVFVSATPTIELYYQTQIGGMIAVELKERYAEATLPKVEFIGRETEEGISLDSYHQVFHTLKTGKQVLFYINQRGFSSTVICGNCHHDYRCPQCDITLTFHKKKDILICHYCGYREAFTGECHECGDKALHYIKAGTENIWEQLQKRFAEYHVVRFDSDNVSQPGRVQETLKEFRENQIHILVGTQMIIKGHDFKNVGLVVVLAPEKYLLLPDYRSGERMFSHIMQVAGRAGRDKQVGLGKVIVETDIAHHYALVSAKKHSYLDFFEKEIEYRRAFDYPPFSKLIRLVFRGLNGKEVEAVSHQVKSVIQQKFKKGIIILGPSPCLLEKQNRYFRWNILLKLKQQKYFLENIQKTQLAIDKKVYMEIDVSPVDLF